MVSALTHEKESYDATIRQLEQHYLDIRLCYLFLKQRIHVLSLQDDDGTPFLSTSNSSAFNVVDQIEISALLNEKKVEHMKDMLSESCPYVFESYTKCLLAHPFIVGKLIQQGLHAGKINARESTHIVIFDYYGGSTSGAAGPSSAVFAVMLGSLRQGEVTELQGQELMNALHQTLAPHFLECGAIYGGGLEYVLVHITPLLRIGSAHALETLLDAITSTLAHFPPLVTGMLGALIGELGNHPTTIKVVGEMFFRYCLLPSIFNSISLGLADQRGGLFSEMERDECGGGAASPSSSHSSMADRALALLDLRDSFFELVQFTKPRSEDDIFELGSLSFDSFSLVSHHRRASSPPSPAAQASWKMILKWLSQLSRPHVFKDIRHSVSTQPSVHSQWMGDQSLIGGGSALDVLALSPHVKTLPPIAVTYHDGSLSFLGFLFQQMGVDLPNLDKLTRLGRVGSDLTEASFVFPIAIDTTFDDSGAGGVKERHQFHHFHSSSSVLSSSSTMTSSSSFVDPSEKTHIHLRTRIISNLAESPNLPPHAFLALARELGSLAERHPELAGLTKLPQKELLGACELVQRTDIPYLERITNKYFQTRVERLHPYCARYARMCERTAKFQFELEKILGRAQQSRLVKLYRGSLEKVTEMDIYTRMTLASGAVALLSDTTRAVSKQYRAHLPFVSTARLHRVLGRSGLPWQVALHPDGILTVNSMAEVAVHYLQAIRDSVVEHSAKEQHIDSDKRSTTNGELEPEMFSQIDEAPKYVSRELDHLKRTMAGLVVQLECFLEAMRRVGPEDIPSPSPPILLELVSSLLGGRGGQWERMMSAAESLSFWTVSCLRQPALVAKRDELRDSVAGAGFESVSKFRKTFGPNVRGCMRSRSIGGLLNQLCGLRDDAVDHFAQITGDIGADGMTFFSSLLLLEYPEFAPRVLAVRLLIPPRPQLFSLPAGPSRSAELDSVISPLLGASEQAKLTGLLGLLSNTLQFLCIDYIPE
eukprot:gnl/Dysnectes_brevis/6479_a10078_298.p1 GENE.gnl/Dysnectes_brevis/6479_a10078_298~~gnl/Dysnectes_brevis/6479_a10078_298.p1  ORF type:complete len:1044 (-),score=101.84 gnl/Dysnectes_brevis/6479_a10078_298:1490-4468(-)